MSVGVLLQDRIDQIFIANPELKSSHYNQFELAVAQISNIKILGGLEYEDLVGGILGNGGDEGIDLFYLYKDGFFIKEYEEIKINKSTQITVKLFQVKKETGFSTNGFRVFVEGIRQMLDFDLSIDDLMKIGANQEYCKMVKTIRDVYRKTSKEFAKFVIEASYVTVASQIEISEKIDKLIQNINEDFPNITMSFDFWGAQKLLDFSQKTDEKLEIEFKDQPIVMAEKGSKSSGNAGFVKGNKLIESLLDDKKRFRSELTDGNVRFFLGKDKIINHSIIETALDIDKATNFWAMNNGITIICDDMAPVSSREFIISNPQIVNGCQTIHCLYSAYKKNNSLPEDLSIFTKIVKTNDDIVQTDIIRATNSQNPVKSANLKANDTIQRNIEIHLQPDFLYERRDNYYKNQGHTGYKVISLMRMAQIVHSIVNKEGVAAVNDINSIIESDMKYKSIFNNQADYDLYKFGCQLYIKIWSKKNSDLRANVYDSDYRELISKGGFLLLHVMSSLLFCHAYSIINKEVSVEIDSYKIYFKKSKNKFSICKDKLFKMLIDESFIDIIYKDAKGIIVSASIAYITSTSKTQNSLFKYRKFDKDYLINEIRSFVKSDKFILYKK